MASQAVTNGTLGWALMGAAVAALGAAGCNNPTTSLGGERPLRPSFGTFPAVIVEMRGAGTLGDGAPTTAGGVNRQLFAFDAGISSDIVFGTLDYTDSGFTKPDGKPPHFVVGPAYPGTVVATFVQMSNTCVEFDGQGEVLNTGEILAFRIQACDNGSPGVGLDVFAIYVPERLLTDGQAYQRGPDMITSGEITATTASVPALGMTHMSGDGAIGDGAPMGGGVNRQVFQFDMGVDKAVVAGTLAYTDSSDIMADGKPATLVVNPSAAGTAFTTFQQLSNACAEFSGVGLVQNTGELMGFGGRACDDGPGYLDVFTLWVPSQNYRRGPDTLAWGDVVATLVTT